MKKLKTFVGGMYERYRAHHALNRALLDWAGLCGCIVFPMFYLVRFTGKLPPRYDDFELRLAATVLCAALALRRWWPEKYKRYYLPYSFLTVCYCLSFLLSFTLLQNTAAMNTVVNMVIGVIFITLLTDWRNTIAMLILGYSSAFAVYWMTAEAPEIPFEFLYWWVPLCGVLVTGASISKFVGSRAELERMRLMYTGLAGSIAHELRNPLVQAKHVLDSMASQLAAAPAGDVISYTHQQVSEMVRSVGQGQDAIARGLQSITVTLHHLKPHAFDAANLTYLSAAKCVQKAIAEYGYESPAQREKVCVHELGDFTFKGVETAFVLVMFNLIKNALYYLPLRPAATVTVTIDRHRIVVRDTGPGIEPDMLARLFDEFHTAGKSEGTGLGLAYCKRAMRDFGGDISCRSRLGKFTEFMLTFPRLPEAEIHASQLAIMGRAEELLDGRPVLVVDDDAMMRRSTMAKLALLGCDADEAGDGLQALDAMRRKRYELVVMDINMPLLDGYDTTRAIRQGAVPGQQRVPILALSGNPIYVLGVKSKQAGMNGFLGKPCDELELAAAITQVLESVAPREGSHDAIAGATVFLAEDNAFQRAVVKSYLVDIGMQVIEAEHGHEVLQALQAGARPAAIVMDMNMPGLNGIETTRALRAMPEPLRSIPVLALTGHSSQRHMEAALEAGMNGFLTKPVDIVSLRTELGRVLAAQPPLPDALQPALPLIPALAPLLNTARIDRLKRMGVLEDLLPECLADIRRLVADLVLQVASQDRSAAHDTLHSLVGITGEAGAQALYESASAVYSKVDAGTWPHNDDWVAHLRNLVDDTEKGMVDRYAIRSK